jgi:HD-GYP domain-containing protein (c-di-GMP phosphodiesterase class II)
MKSEVLKHNIEKALEALLAFSRETNFYDLLNTIMTKMMDLTNADAGTLYVVEDEQLVFRIMKTLSLNICHGAADQIDLPPIELNAETVDNISAYAAINNELVSIDDVYESSRFNFSGPKNYDNLTGYKTQSMLVFPLATTENEVIGVIQLINAIDRETGAVVPFGAAFDTSMLLALASASANALANILYAREIDELFHSFVRVLTKAIDERSAYSVNHTNNVAKLCGDFAEYLSKKFPKGHVYHFSDNRQSQLVMAAYLHDVGKIVTPLNIMDKRDRLGDQLESVLYRFDIKALQLERDCLAGKITRAEYEEAAAYLAEILDFVIDMNNAGYMPEEKFKKVAELKHLTFIDRFGQNIPIFTAENIESLNIRKGTLTVKEREIMQEHAAITQRWLDNMKFNKSYKHVSRWASSHHEHLDGTGYPGGLNADEIELEICILTILDIFDALTASDRPYRKSMPIDKAYGILRSMVDEGKLHKELVELFIESGLHEKII